MGVDPPRSLQGLLPRAPRPQHQPPAHLSKDLKVNSPGDATARTKAKKSRRGGGRLEVEGQRGGGGELGPWVHRVGTPSYLQMAIVGASCTCPPQ